MSNTVTPHMPWYRVPEVWLILILLGASVIGSFALLAEAMDTTDVHLVVPGDAPRSSKIPPSRSAPVAPPEATRESTPVP